MGLVSNAWFEARVWLLAIVVVLAVEVATLSGPNVCMVKQKYNITKRIKYRAPMSVRTYEWCFSMPPRCSRWNTEMRDLTRLETEERIAEVAVCCPGYKMKDVSCVPICPNGKTGPGCSQDCAQNKWGPNCVHHCKECAPHGICLPTTGECDCREGWQGERCEIVVTTTTTSTTPAVDLLTTSRATTNTPITSSTAFAIITTVQSSINETASSATEMVSSNLLPLSTKSPSQQQIITKILLNITSPIEITTPTLKISTDYTNVTLKPATFNKESDESKIIHFHYNRTETPLEGQESTYFTKLVKTTTETILTSTKGMQEPKIIRIADTSNQATKVHETTKEPSLVPNILTTKSPEITVKSFPTTLKFKPKEIWIRPAQKGESSIVETKTKINNDLNYVKNKNATKIEIIPNTTPKTIIVSIIPTSVSYATFKKIALTTASYISLNNSTAVKAYSKVADGITKPMFIQTSTQTPFLKHINNATKKSNATVPVILVTESINDITTTQPVKTVKPSVTSATKSMFVNNTTNSMSRTSNETQQTNSSNSITSVTISSTNITSYSHRRNMLREKPITISKTTSLTQNSTITAQVVTSKPMNDSNNVTNINATVKSVADKAVKPIVKNTTKEIYKTNEFKSNLTKVSNSKTNTITTDKPAKDEETFHILTEPEHITAVMTEKGSERTSVDLVSVISIAGGVMMAVITVAVVIVMIERCKRPRYEDVRKVNDIRMQVMIENNDVPPPYVRSIFHTPLPDPPTSEKCHYQPISTLDRNLKQFMRPVVVQAISPIMLENFRGILECHYDHLPRRSNDFSTLPVRCSAPSSEISEQLRIQRASLTESAIEALKCEAKLDVIDSTTAEPLYAEIPCWRPPSEHAIEIMNLNGEAVTEL